MRLSYKYNEAYIVMLLERFLIHVGQEVMSQIYSLNKGGCCVYAALIAQRIRKYFPFVRVYLRVIDDMRKATIYGARQNVKANTLECWNSNGLEFGHVMLQIRYKDVNLLCDSECMENYKSALESLPYWIVMHSGSITIKEALELSKDNHWNHEFDRRQIPELKRIIRQEFRRLITALVK